MLKERLNLSIGEDASRALTVIAKTLAISRTAAIELALLECVERRRGPGEWQQVEKLSEAAERHNATPARQVTIDKSLAAVNQEPAVGLSREEWAQVAAVDRHDQAESSFNDPARAEKKAAKVSRKAKLQEDTRKFLGTVEKEFGADVAEALAGRRELGNAASAAFEAMGVKVIDVTPCSHPAASRTTGKNWKCTKCGYQHETAS